MNTDNISTSSKRNYGIDLLRLVSMYMVVALHVLGCGGIIDTCDKFSANYYASWLMETASYCSVNIFAMITGYVMVNSKFNYFKIIPLWMTVSFYGAITLLLFRFVPYLHQLYAVCKLDFLKATFMPATTHQYWYFTSYFCMFFFIPFINRCIFSLSKKDFKILCITIIVLFSIISPLFTQGGDPFRLGYGYCQWWLICMYFIGAYLKLHPIEISKSRCLLIYVIATLCAWFIGHVLMSIFGSNYEPYWFVDYTSVFIVISSIALLLLFSQLDITRTRAQKAISFFSPLAFSVYLIHVQPLTFNCLLPGKFSSFAHNNVAVMTGKTIIAITIMFIACLLIDIPRHYLFKALRINNIVKNLQGRFNRNSNNETSGINTEPSGK